MKKTIFIIICLLSNLVLAKEASLPYSYGVMVGYASSAIAWHEICIENSKSPELKEIFKKSFFEWKTRHAYFDKFRDAFNGTCYTRYGFDECRKFSKSFKTIPLETKLALKKEYLSDKNACSMVLVFFSNKKNDFEYSKRDDYLNLANHLSTK